MDQYVVKIRKQIGLQDKVVEYEKGIKGKEGFFWAFPNGFDKIRNDWEIFYEIENGQEHPCTNVLKYWPILEERLNLKILLIQWLIKKPKSRNRWELSKFVASKIIKENPDRFKYVFLEYEDFENQEKLKELKYWLNTQL